MRSQSQGSLATAAPETPRVPGKAIDVPVMRKGLFEDEYLHPTLFAITGVGLGFLSPGAVVSDGV